jgi:predicted Zn-dependent protease with MMP-like domain
VNHVDTLKERLADEALSTPAHAETASATYAALDHLTESQAQILSNLADAAAEHRVAADIHRELLSASSPEQAMDALDRLQGLMDNAQYPYAESLHADVEVARNAIAAGAPDATERLTVAADALGAAVDERAAQLEVAGHDAALMMGVTDAQADQVLSRLADVAQADLDGRMNGMQVAEVAVEQLGEAPVTVEQAIYDALADPALPEVVELSAADMAAARQAIGPDAALYSDAMLVESLGADMLGRIAADGLEPAALDALREYVAAEASQQGINPADIDNVAALAVAAEAMRDAGALDNIALDALSGRAEMTSQPVEGALNISASEMRRELGFDKELAAVESSSYDEPRTAGAELALER